ncbi:VirK/YbjX family protein [Carnimonas bestiolae]|uniref:VirK/YbjX family protein n=1 Tax=Carnimonas bestiolae TaxID=3402172 RepID=UPI003EDC56AE
MSKQSVFKKKRRQLKLAMRRFLLGDAYRAWQRELANLPPVVESEKFDRELRDRPLYLYIHRKWSKRSRLALVRDHYEWYAKAEKTQVLRQQLQEQRRIVVNRIKLKDGGYYTTTLAPSYFPQEGELAMSLNDAEGRRLCMVSFSVHRSEGVLALTIGGLQGADPALGKDAIKTAARQMYGFRPKNFVMSMIYALADVYDIAQLLAIDNASHIKHKRIKSSYDELWQELGGVAHSDGFYQLPRHEWVKDVADVKSKHRSEYRRRLGVREAAISELQNALLGGSGSASEAGVATFASERQEFHPQ